MAMSEARQRRLALGAIVALGLPQAGETPATVKAPEPPKGELARARAKHEKSYAALSEEQRVIFERWVQYGPPFIGRTLFADQREQVPTLETTNVVAGEEQSHLPEWGKGVEIDPTIAHIGTIDWSEFPSEERAFARIAWDDRAYYLALACDLKILKDFWPARGGCREGDMGVLRDEISGIRQIKVLERTREQVEYLRQLEAALVRAEHSHESPLREARDLYKRQGKPVVEAYTAPTVCPHCSGTSVLRPVHDAPESVVAEWREKALAGADRRYIALEAARRAKLVSLSLEARTALGLGADETAGRETWADFRRRVMKPISANMGAKDLKSKLRNDASGPGQNWMRR